jgi:hypothetical protein
MKRLLRYIVLAVLGIAIVGCSTAMQEVKAKSQSERTDVFSEVKDESTPPKGFVDLVIRGSIKTHLESYYILESKESLHGKQSYPFLINIDGQAALWNVEGVRDNKPAYDKDGKTSHDPEAREGLKYILEKRIILTAGSHKVFFALPDDKYSVEVKITLNEGESSVLEFKPIYRAKRIPTRIPSFLEGIDKYEVFLNGNQIR